MKSSQFSSLFSTEIVVYVFYCGGAKYITVNKIINGNKFFCTKESGEDMINEHTEVNSDKLILYPNPAQDILHVKDCENIRIINSQGQIVKAISSAIEVIDINDLARGLYIFQGTRNGSPVKTTFQKE